MVSFCAFNPFKHKIGACSGRGRVRRSLTACLSAVAFFAVALVVPGPEAERSATESSGWTALTLLAPAPALAGSVSNTGASPRRARNAVPGDYGVWTVEAVAGEVRFLTSNAQGAAQGDAERSAGDTVIVGMSFSAPTRLRSGSDSGATLFNGHDRITLAPNSEIQFPHRSANENQVVIVQFKGTVRYDVESRRRNSEASSGLLGGLFAALFDSGVGKAFQVHTPYLIAGVKGTSFDVSVSREASSVDVHEGVVEVGSRESSRGVDVTAGRSATVSREQRAEVSVSVTAELANKSANGIAAGPGSNNAGGNGNSKGNNGKGSGGNGSNGNGSNGNGNNGNGNNGNGNNGNGNNGNGNNGNNGNGNNGNNGNGNGNNGNGRQSHLGIVPERSLTFAFSTARDRDGCV